MSLTSLTIEMGLDTTAFSAGISKINQEIKAAQSSFKAFNTSSGEDALRRSIEALGRVTEAQRTKVDLLRAEYDKTVVSKGKFSAEALRLETALNNATVKLNTTETQLRRLNNELESSPDAIIEMNQELSSLNTTMDNSNTTFGGFLDANRNLLIGLGTISAAIGVSSTKIAMDFEESMARVRATTNAVDKDFKALYDSALLVGRETQFSSVQTAGAMNFLGLAGWTPEMITSSIRPLTDFTMAIGGDLASTTDLVTDSISALGLSYQELERYLDMVADAQRRGNTTATQLMQANIKVGASFKGLNIELPESQAFLVSMANRGLKAAEAGTALSAIITSVTDKTGESYKMMEKYNISVFDLNGKFRGLTNVLGDLKKAYDAGTEAEKTYIANSLGGRAYTNVVRGIFDGLQSEIPDLMVKLDLQSSGAVSEQVDIIGGTAVSAVKSFQSAVEGFQIIIGELFLPGLTTILNGFTSIINSVSPETIRTATGIGVGATAVTAGIATINYTENILNKQKVRSGFINRIQNEPMVNPVNRLSPTGVIRTMDTGLLNQASMDELIRRNPSLYSGVDFRTTPFSTLNSMQQTGIRDTFRAGSPATDSHVISRYARETGRTISPEHARYATARDLGTVGTTTLLISKVLDTILGTISTVFKGIGLGIKTAVITPITTAFAPLITAITGYTASLSASATTALGLGTGASIGAAATTFIAILTQVGLALLGFVGVVALLNNETKNFSGFLKSFKETVGVIFDPTGSRFEKKLDAKFKEEYGPNSEYTKRLTSAYLNHPTVRTLGGMQDDTSLGRNTSKIHLGFEDALKKRTDKAFRDISERTDALRNAEIDSLLNMKQAEMEDARYEFKINVKKSTDLKLRSLDKEIQAHREMLDEKRQNEADAISKSYDNEVKAISKKYDYLKTQNDKIFNDIIMAGINAEIQAINDKKEKKLKIYTDELNEQKQLVLDKHQEIIDELTKIYDKDIELIMSRPMEAFLLESERIRRELGEYPDETISIKTKIDTEGNEAITNLIEQRDTIKNIINDIISESDRTSNIAIKQTLTYDIPDESKPLYTQLSQNKVIIDNMRDTSKVIRDITSTDVLYREAALQRITDSHIKSQDKMLAKEIENMAYRRDNMNETITIVYRLKNADEDIRTASLDTIYQSEIDANHKLLSVIFKTNYEKLLSWEDYLNSIKELSRANGDDLIELMEKIREFEHDSNNEALLGIIESNKQKLESFRTLTDDIRLLTHKFEDYSIGALKRITNSAISENAKRLADSIFTNNAVINSNNKEIQEILKRRNERNEIDRRAQLELAIKTARTCKQLQDAKKALEEFDLVAAENKVIEALRDHNSELAESIERDTNDINDMIKLEQEDLVKDTDKNFNMLVNNVTGHIGKMKIKLDDDLSAIISGITNSVGKLNYELNFMYKDLQEGISDSIELLSDKQKDIMDDLANVMDSYYADKITLIEENMKKEHELNKEDIEFKTNNNAQILKMDEDNAIMLRDMRTADFDLDMAIEKSRQKFIVEQLDDHHTELINSYIHRLDAEFAEELSAIDRRKRAEEFEHIKRMEDIQGRLDEELELLKKGYDSQIKELNKRYEALLEPFLDAMSDRRDAILRESEKIIQGMDTALKGHFDNIDSHYEDLINSLNQKYLDIGMNERMDYLNEQMSIFYNNSKALDSLGIPNVSSGGDLQSSMFSKKIDDDKDSLPALANVYGTVMTNVAEINKLLDEYKQLGQSTTIKSDFNISDFKVGLKNSLAPRGITTNEDISKILTTLNVTETTKSFSKNKFNSLYESSKDKLPIDKDTLTALFKELGIELFAKGGVVNKATLAIIGEGHHSEAVIPLNDKSFGAIASGISSKLGSDKTINTPMLATGGIINSPTLAVIGEGKDSEAVIPLNTKSFSQIASGIFNQLRTRLDPTTAMLRGLAEIRNSIFTVGIAVVNLLRNGSLVNNNSGQTESIETRMMEHKLPLASLIKINTEALGLIVNVNSSMLTELSTTLIEMTDLIDDTNMLILSNSVEHYDKMVETYGKFNSNLRIMTIKSGLGLRASWEESISGIVSRFESFTSMAYQAGYNFINALYTGMRSQFAQLNNVIEEAEALLKRVRMPEEVTKEVNDIIDNVNKDIELQVKLKAPDFNDFKLYADNIGPSSNNNTNTEVASNGITINIDTVNAQNDGDFMAMLNSTIKRAGRG